MIANLFDGVPLKENYRTDIDGVIKLKAPPIVARLCYLFEIFIFCLVFAVTFYYTNEQINTQTIITYELKEYPYSCNVLSPLDTGRSYSTSHSTCAQFSSVRYSYDECMNTLGTDGLDVCHDENRLDYVISVSGVSGDDDHCKDLLLLNGYKFCKGGDKETNFLGYSQFIYQTGRPTGQFNDSYFFMSSESELIPIETSFSSIQSDFITDGNDVYVVAQNKNDGKYYIYQLTRSSAVAVPLTPIDVAFFNGLCLGDGKLYFFSLEETIGTIYGVNLTTLQVSSYEIDCGPFLLQGSTVTPTRYLSYGDDGMLYVMCTGDTVLIVSGAAARTAIYEFSFLQVDPADGRVVRDFYSNLYTLNMTKEDGSVDTSSSGHVTYVSSLLVRNKVAYAFTGAKGHNVIAIDTLRAVSQAPSVMPVASPTAPTAPTVGGGPPGGGGSTLSVVASATAAGDVVVQKRRMRSSNFISMSGKASSKAGSTRSDLGNAKSSNSGGSSTRSHVHTQEGAHLLNSASVYGYASGNYMVAGWDNAILYFPEATYTYTNISSGVTNTATQRTSYFYATSVQLGISYGICDENITRYTIDPTFERGYAISCGQKNGIFYQNNDYIRVPDECATAISAPEAEQTKTMLASCMAVQYANFTSTYCKDSFDTVCATVYTNNPPFSCSRETKTSLFVVLASAFSNGTGAWSIAVVVIVFMLKRKWPGGYLYDLKTKHRVEGDPEVLEQLVLDPESMKFGGRALVDGGSLRASIQRSSAKNEDSRKSEKNSRIVPETESAKQQLAAVLQESESAPAVMTFSLKDSPVSKKEKVIKEAELVHIVTNSEQQQNKGEAEKQQQQQPHRLQEKKEEEEETDHLPPV